MSTSDDERRLRESFKEAAPEFGPMDAKDLHRPPDLQRRRRATAIAGTVALLAAVVVGVTIFRQGEPRHAAGRQSGPAVSATPLGDPATLNPLAAEAPCE